MDVIGVEYDVIDDCFVCVMGSIWVFSDIYIVKLEGVCSGGY